VANKFSLTGVYSIESQLTQYRMICWILFLVGILLALSSGLILTSKQEAPVDFKPDTSTFCYIEKNFNLFIKKKIVLWIVALPVLFILFMVFMVFPIGVPVFNLTYVGFIASYGIVLYRWYKKGKMPSVTGKFQLSLHNDFQHFKKRDLLPILIVGFGTLFTVLYIILSGIGEIFFMNARIIWIIVFTIFSFIGFLIGAKEVEMIQNSSNIPKKGSLILNIVNFLPFYLSLVLFAAIQSISGLLGAFQSLLILIIAILAGTIIQNLGKNSWMTAIFQAFLLQWAIASQSALFHFF
jgi:hypothetical protein